MHLPPGTCAAPVARGSTRAASFGKDAVFLRLMLCLLSTFAAPTQPQQCLFSGASLRNHSGARVECSRFAGRQVALYFAGEWCPLCRYAAESSPPWRGR